MVSQVRLRGTLRTSGVRVGSNHYHQWDLRGIRVGLAAVEVAEGRGREVLLSREPQTEITKRYLPLKKEDPALHCIFSKGNGETERAPQVPVCGRGQNDGEPPGSAEEAGLGSISETPPTPTAFQKGRDPPRKKLHRVGFKLNSVGN